MSRHVTSLSGMAINVACFQLEKLMGFTSTNASEYASIMLGKSDRTIQQWKADFLAIGDIADSQQGRHQRSGILWSSEELNKKASTNVKGMPNRTVSSSFCSWLNDELLPNSCLETGFPRHVSMETARKWLHQLGFEVLSSTKGLYFDGHEREDSFTQSKLPPQRQQPLFRQIFPLLPVKFKTFFSFTMRALKEPKTYA